MRRSISTILVPLFAFAWCASSAGCSGGKVAPLDPASLRLQRQIPLPQGKPLLVATAHDPERLYVVSAEPRALWRVERQRGTLQRIDVGSGPIGLRLDGARRRLFVCLSVENALGVVDIESNQLMYKIGVGLSPFDVVISADGTRAYVSHHA
ncbi:MAG: hypothetical protein KC609_15535, partial [Myxococcales bacterium]|nr:hypothetical protein [Myxococcales bacterium]